MDPRSKLNSRPDFGSRLLNVIFSIDQLKFPRTGLKETGCSKETGLCSALLSEGFDWNSVAHQRTMLSKEALTVTK